MPYAMSVIVSRAIPEIDGFKPSHRKLLYTMYKMGLFNGGRTKSANIVGQTMRLNPHGDAAIYETMVRLRRGYEALLHPFVDSKGNFGKAYSRDMAYAASRYTEAKLDTICQELFRDIDSDTVDFVDNYDSTMKEPTLLAHHVPQCAGHLPTWALPWVWPAISAALTSGRSATTAIARDQESGPRPSRHTLHGARIFPPAARLIYDESEMRQDLRYRPGQHHASGPSGAM